MLQVYEHLFGCVSLCYKHSFNSMHKQIAYSITSVSYYSWVYELVCELVHKITYKDAANNVH